MLDLLEEKNYVVKIQKDDNAVNVKFPLMILLNPDIPQLNFRYHFVYGKKETEINITKRGQNTNSYSVTVPNYAVRNYISLDIATSMRTLGLPSSIVIYYDENGNRLKGFEDTLAVFDAAREGFLTKIYIAGQQDGFANYNKVAKQHKVLDGYKLLVEHFN